MNRRLVRSLVALSVLLLTTAASLIFLQRHPSVGRQLLGTSPIILGLLLGLYLLFMVSLWLIFRSSLIICNVRLPQRETLLVTAYSSIINFFGPLQSGPAFRALYLKKQHAVSLKQYTSASLVYYFFYACYSALFLIVGVFGWLILPVGLLLLGGVFFFLRRPLAKVSLRFRQLGQLSWRGIVLTALATLLQVSIFAVIFYVELHSVNHGVSVRQAFIYTGAANFALFVSLTPGAIGFRESFVLLTQQLHHIPDATVIAASLLDRGVYVAMLLLLGVAIFGTQGRASIKRIKS